MKALSDERVEGLVATLLRAGVMLAALVVIGGAIPYLASHPRGHVSYRTFQGEPEDLKSVAGILHDAFAGNARGISNWGCCC